MYNMKYLAFALASMASALPAPAPGEPLKSQEFTLTMDVDGCEWALTTAYNGTQGSNVIKGLEEGMGTAAYLNYSLVPPALDFIIGSSVYGLVVPDGGNDIGYVGSVAAILDDQEAGWQVSHGNVSHTPLGELNTFYACTDEALGQPGYFLKWGTTDGAPETCQKTKVRTKCNVPGGSTIPDCDINTEEA